MKILVFEFLMLRHYCLINEIVLESVTDFYLILLIRTILVQVSKDTHWCNASVRQKGFVAPQLRNISEIPFFFLEPKCNCMF